MLKLAWRNLRRNKLRTLLTVASLISAVLLLCLLTAFLDLLTNSQNAADNRVVVRSAVSLATLIPQAYWQKLETIEHVQGVTPLNWFNGIYKDDRPENFFPRFASDPDTLFKVFPEYTISDAEKEAWKSERAGFVSGKALVDKYGWKVGDQIFIKGDIYPVDLNVTLRGVFTCTKTPSAEKQIFFHRQYLEEAAKARGLNVFGRVGTYFLKVDSPQSVAQVSKTAEAMFANSDSQVRAETEKAFQLSFAEMIGNVRLLFSAIGLAAVISIFFITANTMAMAARERTREVAVLKTLGFGNGQVMWLVIAEALAVGVLGALLGCIVASFAIQGLSLVLDKFMPVFGTLGMSPRVWSTGIAVGLVIGLLSGLLPATAAARLKIVDALRRVA